MSSPPLLDTPAPLERNPKQCTAERIPTAVYQTSAEASVAAAHEIVNYINAHNGKAVLGLATGSSPTELYAELIRCNQKGLVSFKDVVTFNLDEYYPMGPEEAQSYHRFMNEMLFDHIDIDKKNVHIPDGTVKPEDVEAFCKDYERQIAEHGGLDMQVLGIGRSGHIGFNEPGSPIDSITRKIYLDRITRLDASGDFFGIEHVPLQAITMGVGTIMKARRILLLCFSESKARIISRAIEGDSSERVVASLLQRHPNTQAFLDAPAAAELTYYSHPWTLMQHDTTLNIQYSPLLLKKAVVWLSLQCNKPLLKLQATDYYEYHLNHLLERYGSAESLNLFVFQSIQDTISGWPSGKKVQVKERALKVFDHPTLPRKSLYDASLACHKRVVVFSPHPDDDVISMGGTINRLCEQGNEVHTVYETNGSIAVWDDDVRRMVEFAQLYARLAGAESPQFAEFTAKVIGQLEQKKVQSPATCESHEVSEVKRIIRETEAMDASVHAGIPRDRVHFLNLPFYQTGTIQKNSVSQVDVDIAKELLRKIKPELIFAAGDLTDPHGTHRKCTRTALTALHQLEDEGEAWAASCEVMLYRGAWQEWDVEQADLIVPMSPQEVVEKRMIIFKHQSQKDPALFPGADSREFWQRAEQRNANTAELLAKLGFARFAAAEAFVRYHKDMCI